MKRSTLLITGASGFLGRNIIDLMQKTREYRLVTASLKGRIDGAQNFIVDLTKTDFSFLDRVNPDYIIYLGTVSSPNAASLDPHNSYISNVTAIDTMLSKIIKSKKKVKKIVFMSSAVIYKGRKKGKYKEKDELDPYNHPYNFAKFSLECLANYYRETFSLPITVFRLANTYGPHQDTGMGKLLVTELFIDAIKNRSISVNDEKPIRDWVYSGDVAKIILNELKIKESGVYNLGTGKGYSVKDVAEIIARISGSEYKGQRASGKTGSTMTVCDTNSLKRHSGIVPKIGIKEGLMLTYKYYLEKYK